jgi:glycosyltransferase involved in cell wall biosynthesis
MAGGAPVVSSNAGGLPEIIIPGKNGYMSNVGDVEGMSKQAISILKDDKTLASFKANAQAQSLRFDISNIVPQYEELYEKVIAGVPA